MTAYRSSVTVFPVGRLCTQVLNRNCRDRRGQCGHQFRGVHPGAGAPVAFDQEETAPWFEKSCPAPEHLRGRGKRPQQVAAHDNVKRPGCQLRRGSIHDVEFNEMPTGLRFGLRPCHHGRRDVNPGDSVAQPGQDNTERSGPAPHVQYSGRGSGQPCIEQRRPGVQHLGVMQPMIGLIVKDGGGIVPIATHFLQPPLVLQIVTLTHAALLLSWQMNSSVLPSGS